MIFICYILATNITLIKEHSLFDYYFLSLLLSTALSLPLHINKYDTFKKKYCRNADYIPCCLYNAF